MRSALALLVVAGCGFQTPYQMQHTWAESLKPAEVAPAPVPRAGALRVFRVRAYADSEYQAQTPRWNQHVAGQIERASAVLEAQFGVRLELESARPWNRAGPSAHLDKVLEQLVALDNGDGVDWVIGFVAALDVFSAAQDQLGIAGLFGKSLVLRGMVSAAEMDAINASLNLLSATDREQLSRDRRLHKETTILLHEWAHTLGAIHDRSLTLMAPVYDQAQAAFSDSSARIVGLGLEFRSAPASRERWAKAYREALNGPTATFWDAAERDRAMAIADQFFGQGAAPRPPAPLPPEDAQRFEEAARREKLGDASGALKLLVPLVDRYPHAAQVQDLACTTLQESGAPRGAILTGSLRAAQLPDASAQVLLLTAQIQVSGATPADAVPLLARAEARLPPQPVVWLWLAQLHFAAGAISSAERDLTHAAGQKDAETVAAACAQTRRFVGFPEETLPPEREAAYLAAALAAHAQVDRRDLAGALAGAALLARDFPGTPAAAVIECRAKSRSRNTLAIEAACAAAARGAPAAFLPQYILGLVASARSRWAEADTALRRALALDDSTREVWASLAAVQERLRAAAALRDLKSRYRTHFGTALRPALFPAGWAAR